MNCWNMLVVAFAIISCATAFKASKVEPLYCIDCCHNDIDEAGDLYDDNDCAVMML